jgi:hypothetical protein
MSQVTMLVIYKGVKETSSTSHFSSAGNDANFLRHFASPKRKAATQKCANSLGTLVQLLLLRRRRSTHQGSSFISFETLKVSSRADQVAQ